MVMASLLKLSIRRVDVPESLRGLRTLPTTPHKMFVEHQILVGPHGESGKMMVRFWETGEVDIDLTGEDVGHVLAWADRVIPLAHWGVEVLEAGYTCRFRAYAEGVNTDMDCLYTTYGLRKFFARHTLLSLPVGQSPSGNTLYTTRM
jgi:hypothetical protein